MILYCNKLGNLLYECENMETFHTRKKMKEITPHINTCLKVSVITLGIKKEKAEAQKKFFQVKNFISQ